MVTLLVIVSSQPVPATPSSPRSLRVLCGSALSASASLEFKLSTLNHPSPRPYPAALLPRIDVTLTRVKLKSFVCHSCRKHPGWGRPIHYFLPLSTLPSTPSLQYSFRIISLAESHPLSPIESYLFLKQGVGADSSPLSRFPKRKSSLTSAARMDLSSHAMTERPSGARDLARFVTSLRHYLILSSPAQRLPLAQGGTTELFCVASAARLNRWSRRAKPPAWNPESPAPDSSSAARYSTRASRSRL